LNELEGVVDRFVVIEARQDHQLNPKQLLFAKRREEFLRWPIEHMIVDRIDEDGHIEHGAAFAQRKAISRYAATLPDDDLILISDADEIPARWAVEMIKDAPGDAWAFHQRLFYYCANWESDEGWWGTRAYRKSVLPENPRVWRAMGALLANEAPIERAGWHLSWWGGAEGIREKLRAFSDKQWNCPEMTDGDYIERCLSIKRTIHAQRPLKKVPVDHSFPRHLYWFPERYREYID